MKSQLMTTSAALFFACDDEGSIPLSWFDRAVRFLRDHRLETILFTAGGGDFQLDDCNVLADPGGEIAKFGESIPARRQALVAALRKSTIYSLSLDSPREGSQYRSEWRAMASASSITGKIYLGTDEGLVASPVVLMDRAYELANGLFDFRYGFGYKMPLAEEPAAYATGSRPYSFADFQEEMRLKTEGMRRSPSADDLWGDELVGQRRHLTGLFRGAYPVNLLSEAHVKAADLTATQIGKLSKLDDALWLWELSDAEIPQAQALLEAKRVLVSQAD